jgi:hypothetical protein
MLLQSGVRGLELRISRRFSCVSIRLSGALDRLGGLGVEGFVM